MKSMLLLALPLMALVELGSSTYACYQCEDRCITYSWRCDGEVDCPLHAEDERNCEYICPYQTHHRCSDTGICIDNDHLCDERFDCPNGEDESNCYLKNYTGKRGAKKLPTDQERADKGRHAANHLYTPGGFRVNGTKFDANQVSKLLFANRVRK